MRRSCHHQAKPSSEQRCRSCYLQRLVRPNRVCPCLRLRRLVPRSGFGLFAQRRGDKFPSDRGQDLHPNRVQAGDALIINDVMLKKNRSAPDSAVIPVLYYPDVRAAVEWLIMVLPFTERLRIGDHRCQLVHGKGAVVVATPGGHPEADPSTLQSPAGHSVMLRVAGVDQLFERVKAAGARVLTEPADHMYGERQCSFVDPWGRPWTLTETIFDSDPADWGGELYPE